MTPECKAAYERWLNDPETILGMEQAFEAGWAAGGKQKSTDELWSDIQKSQTAAWRNYERGRTAAEFEPFSDDPKSI